MPRYSKEFKSEALQLLKRNSGNINATARQLGVSWRAVSVWSERAAGKNVVVGSAEQEIQRLRRKLAQAEMEREILKKAVAFFAKERN